MKEPDHADPRMRAALEALAETARPSADCPPTGDIWAAVRGELPADRTRALGAHTVECAACAEAWRLAREIGAAPEAPRASGFRRWGGLAAAAILAAVALTVLLKTRPVDEPGLREPSEDREISSVLSQNGTLVRDDCRLVWEGPEGATYSVTVTTADLRPILEADGLQESQLIVDPDLLAAVPDGSALLWHVRGKLPDGTEISRAFRTRLSERER